MSLKTFKSYELAVEFHRKSRTVQCPSYLKNQLLRASSSAALNLAEGSGKETLADQRRFYLISLGSIRECQAVFDLIDCDQGSKAARLLDELAACVYRLCHPKSS